MQPFHQLRTCARRNPAQRILPLIGLGLLSSTVSAQTVKGLITDQNGSLPGASIRVLGNRAGTNTELDGAFSLNADTLGRVALEISYIGHQTRTVELDVQRGLNDLGTLRLETDKSRLGEVLVKGSMAPSQAKAQSIKRNAVAIMEVLSADAIGKLPDRNAAEAVQRIQGVAVARYHGEADQATVRGTPFSWTSTLFNGSRLPSANVMGNRATVLDVIPSEIIQYVQVAKALTPDMEGDAIGGAINFITRTAPEKRTLGISAAGGFNTFSQNGTYNGSVVYGDRFFKNKLGIIVAGAIWDRQWGADSYDISYNTGLSGQQQKSINAVMLKRYMGKRQTYGLNAGAEYVLNSRNKFLVRGLMDRFNDIRPVYESYVDFTNSRYQYNYRYSHYQTFLNGGELGGEHQLGTRLRMDWSYSNYSTRYYLETPPTNPNKGLPIATFRQGITGGFANSSADGKMYWAFDAPDGKGMTEGHMDPQLNNPAELMDATKLRLSQLVIAQLNTKEADQVGQVNFRYEPGARLKLKAGLKFRHKYREGLYGSSFVFAPGSGAPITLSGLETTSFPKGGGFFQELPGTHEQYIMSPLTRDQLFDLYDPATLQANGFRDVTPATNATNIYSGTEDVMAGYAMAEYDLTTKLKLVGGVRNEYTRMQLNGSRAVTEGSPAKTTILPAGVESNYNALLPMLHAKYALNEHVNLRAAYTKTFMRPNFVDLSPGESIDNTRPPMINVTRGNPDLKPTFSNNYDLMGEYYFKGLGLISGGVFYKDISDVVFSNRSIYAEGGNTYMLTQAKNFDRAKLYGLEAGINKRFSFLPGFWSGFGAEFNYTFIESETNLDRLVRNADQSFTTVSDKLQLPNQSRNLFNAILFYERNGVMVRLAGNYRGASVESVNQQLGPEFYVWTDKNFTIDASATVTLTKSVRAFLELNNLSDEPLKTYMGDRRRSTMTEWYGRRGQVGIRWDIIK